MAYATTPQARARLRAERKRRGWDIPRMAQELRDAAEYPSRMPTVLSLQRNIERWEAGRVVRLGERYRLLYARVLNMPEDELFHPDAPPPVEEPPPEAAPGDVAAIRAMLSALTTSDRQFGGGHARQYASDYLGTVIEPRLRGQAPEELRCRLFAISTEFVLRLAGMHLDADQPSMALSLLGKAASMASESTDATLTAWVLARRGEHELHQANLASRTSQRDRHVSEAIAYTEGAAGVARGAPPIASAFLLTKRALAWSIAGDLGKTERALEAVWSAYARTATDPEPDWTGAYGWGHLRHEEARCFANLGLGDRAARAAKDSLTVRTDLRPRAFSLGVLAVGLAQADRIDEACAAARELISLAGQISSRRVSVRVGEVLDALEPYGDSPQVVDVRDAARQLEGSGR